MGDEVRFAGLIWTREEWRELGDDDRLALLQACAAAVARRGWDDSYESYELTVDA
jgi:hypothetical protein